MQMAAQNPKEERTLLIVKPDGVKRGLTGDTISRIEQRGLKIIALEMIHATKEQVHDHYPKDPAWIKRLGEKSINTYKEHGMDPKEELGTDDPAKIGEFVRAWLLDFLTSGPIVKMVIKGIRAVAMVRKIAGKTMHTLAEMGTIRGDFSVDDAAAANKNKRAVHNIVHASETPEEAEHEIDFCFAGNNIKDNKREEEDFFFKTLGLLV